MPFPPRSALGLENIVTCTLDGLRMTAFWAAIALPFLHIPLLYDGTQDVGALLALVAVNVCCLLVGHRHARSGS